jgi:hypothetical protein
LINGWGKTGATGKKLDGPPEKRKRRPANHRKLIVSINIIIYSDE